MPGGSQVVTKSAALVESIQKHTLFHYFIWDLVAFPVKHWQCPFMHQFHLEMGTSFASYGTCSNSNTLQFWER